MLVLAFYLVSFSVELLISARLTCCILPDLFLVKLLIPPADGIHSLHSLYIPLISCVGAIFLAPLDLRIVPFGSSSSIFTH